jgi:hypothetical protein
VVVEVGMEEVVGKDFPLHGHVEDEWRGRRRMKERNCG